MKTLQEVVKKRKELQEELNNYQSDRSKLGAWSEFTEEDKKNYSRIHMNIKMLQIQIDALTYVINYDSELRDVTIYREMVSNRD